MPPKASFIRIAGFIVIGIFFLGFLISLFRNPQPEQSPGPAKLDKKTAIEKSLTEGGKEQPTEIANSKGDTKDMPLNIQPSENKIVAKYIEKNDIDQKQPSKNLEGLGTGTIVRDEGSVDQLLGKKFMEDKHSTIDEEKSTVLQTAIQSPKTREEQPPLVLSAKKVLIYFDRDSTEIDSQQLETLADIAFYLSRNADISIIVEGYTDSYDDDLYNNYLSQLRANTVKSYLVDKGVANSRISAIGLGPQNPVSDNENREGRSKNRRVEIKLELSTKDDVIN